MRVHSAARGASASKRAQAQELDRLQRKCAALLKEVVRAQEQSGEFRRRSQRSQAELEHARSELQRAHTTIGKLRLRMAALNRTVFGRKSEKPPEPEPEADSEPEPESAGESQDSPEQPGKDSGKGRTGGKKKGKRGRQPGSATPPRRDRSRLPKLLELLELPEHERRCSRCGKPFVRCGTKASTIFEIDLVAFARKILRQCYEPGCGCAEPKRLLAPPAPRLWNGTQLGTSVWAWSVVQVFHMRRSQAAVARDLDAIGLGMAPSTLAQGLQRLGRLVKPLEQAIAEHLGKAAVVQADETSWPVQHIDGQQNGKQPPASGARPKHWLWMVCCEDAVWMRILPTRGLPSGGELLGKLGQGTLQLTLVCDRWSAYAAFSNRFPNVRLQLCWSHQRRDVCRVEAGFPELQPWAEAWLGKIGGLFHLEHLRCKAWQPEVPLEDQGEDFAAAQASLEAGLGSFFDDAQQEWQRLARRHEVLTGLQAGGGRYGAELARVEAQGKAMASLLVNEEGLSVFLEDPRIPMDNNRSERIVRGPAIARYVSFGSGGPAGAKATGRLWTVLATAHLARLNVYRYVLDYLDACAHNRGQAPSDLSPWLPWEMDKQRMKELRAPPQRWWTPADGSPSARAQPPGLPAPRAA